MRDIITLVREYDGSERYNHEMLSLMFSELSYFFWDQYSDLGIRNHMISFNAFTEHNIGRDKIGEVIWDELHENEYFQDAKIGYFHEQVDVETGVQFAAITVEFKGMNYVCYRGTDMNISGWKEDIELGYEDTIPSQLVALGYLRKVASKINGEMIVSGHSKGGHVAIYACANASNSIKDRVRQIISFDGVGFRQKFYRSKAYGSIRDKVVKYVPKHSFVGLLFGNDRRTTLKIVDSKNFGFGQHDFTNWKIADEGFALVDRVSNRQRTFAKNFNKWIFGLKKPEARKLIDTLYGIAVDLGIKDINDASKKLMSLSGAMLKRFFGTKNAVSKKESSKIFGDLIYAAIAG